MSTSYACIDARRWQAAVALLIDAIAETRPAMCQADLDDLHEHLLAAVPAVTRNDPHGAGRCHQIMFGSPVNDPTVSPSQAEKAGRRGAS